MLNQKFYWGTTRKAITAFGNLFNNIHIDRRDADGNVIQTLKVPLSYAPRQKFLARISARPDGQDSNFQTIIPRMGFEMTGITYDPGRRVSLVQQNRAVNNTTNTLNAQYAPSPYNIDISLLAYTKNQDDGLQIIEQILPYFNPDFNLSLNAIPALNIKNDLQVLLTNVTYEDEYEGDFRSRRAIIWTLNFTLKLNYFGPINKQNIIRTSTVNTFNDAELTQRIQPYSVTADPNNALPGDTVGFIESFEDF